MYISRGIVLKSILLLVLMQTVKVVTTDIFYTFFKINNQVLRL